MKKSDFQSRKKEIQIQFEEPDYDFARELALDLIDELHEQEDFDKIVELYLSKFIEPKSLLYCFEVAYALVEKNYKLEAEVIYEEIIKDDPDNSSALNNLSIIKRAKGQIDEAFNLIDQAYALNPDDEIISNNYNSLLSIISEKKEIEAQFKHAVTLLQRENQFVIDKLTNFLNNVKRDDSHQNNKMPIPKWKFKVLMGTDEQKSLSLLDQWTEKGYLRKTGGRGQYNEFIYEINPFLEKGIRDLKPSRINQNWINGINNLNVDYLEELAYFEVKKRIVRVKKNIRNILLRDVDELFFNHVMGNKKSVVILSGSIVEILLIYYCEKKKIRKIKYQINNRTISKNLYECNLGDLLSYIDQNRLNGDVLVHLGNISRIYRNYIHPGKELSKAETLTENNASLCFLSTIETIKAICN